MLVIVTLYVKSFVCVPSLSSQLLLRIFPNFFDYFGSSPMCLSSPNRSNSKAFRHIMPYSAPLCKGMIYSKTGLPWQMNSTFILFSINYLFLSNYLKPLILLDLLDFYFFINLPSTMIISLLPISLQYLTL